MGRADIAILSEISFGIRLCLHPLHFRLGGRRMMTGTFLGRTIVVPPRRNAVSRAAALAISLAAIFARLSRYGVIRFDRSPSLTDKNHNPDVNRPALWQDCP